MNEDQPPALNPAPCSLHVTNLGPREAKFLASIMKLFTDPPFKQMGSDVMAGEYFIGVDQVTAHALVFRPTIALPAADPRFAHN